MLNINADFYTSEELKQLGIKCGKNCLISKTTTFINTENLILGDNVRIDGYSLISCGIGINIGSFVHIASHAVLMGGADIEIGNYASIASGAKVYSISDDVMGRGMVGPCVDESLRYLHKGKIIIGDHAVLAINSTMMPGSMLPTGSTLTAGSLLMKSKVALVEFSAYSGIPAIWTKSKEPRLAELAKTYK